MTSIPAQAAPRVIVAMGFAAMLAAVAPAAAADAAVSTRKPAPAAATRSVAPAPATTPAEQLIVALEKRLASMRSLAANFTQTFRSAALDQQVIERGRIFVGRPGRMRWDYRQPEKKVFLVEEDGTTLSYVPADLMAVRGHIPADAPHLQLLLGKSHLLDAFTVTSVKLKGPVLNGSHQLKLTPRREGTGIELVYLELDPATRGLVRVLVIDPLGNESDLVLEKVSENAILKNDTFELKLPPGIRVRDAEAASGGI